MMGLDDPQIYLDIDTDNIYQQVDHLPEQLVEAWNLGYSYELAHPKPPSKVVIAGMGISGLSAQLISRFVGLNSNIQVHVHQDYGLPRWACGPDTLVVASSISGDTEEIIDVVRVAVESHCGIIVITSGGALEVVARDAGLPLMKYDLAKMSSELAYAFCLPLAVLVKVGLLPNPEKDIFNMVEVLKEQQLSIQKEIPAARNPAKRTAGQLMGRFVTIMSSGILEPAVQSWKIKLSKFANVPARIEILPEADHHSVLEVMRGEQLSMNEVVFFLRAVCEHPRNQIRSELTRKLYMLQGIGTDFWDALGETPIDNIWSLIHFGDYVAYYLALAYGVNPSQKTEIKQFKQELAQQ